MKYTLVFLFCVFLAVRLQAQEFSNAQIEKDHRYYSYSQSYFLIFQGDGNLVMYTASGSPVWSSQTNGRPVTNCIMQGDGNLVLYNGSQPVWDSKTCCYPDNPSKLAIQDDGNLVIYVQLCGNWIATWSSMGGKIPQDQIDAASQQAHNNGSKTASVKGTGPYQGPPGFGRGMATTMYCGNSPESWVRGSATLDQASGTLLVTIQLETDAVNAGPKGKVTAVLKDFNGNVIANVSTDEIGTGGKAPGSAAIRNFSSHIQIDPAIAKNTCSIYLLSQCTGSSTGLFNLPMSTVTDAFKIFLTVAQ